MPGPPPRVKCESRSPRIPCRDVARRPSPTTHSPGSPAAEPARGGPADRRGDGVARGGRAHGTSNTCSFRGTADSVEHRTASARAGAARRRQPTAPADLRWSRSDPDSPARIRGGERCLRPRVARPLRRFLTRRPAAPTTWPPPRRRRRRRRRRRPHRRRPEPDRSVRRAPPARRRAVRAGGPRATARRASPRRPTAPRSAPTTSTRPRPRRPLRLPMRAPCGAAKDDAQARFRDGRATAMTSECGRVGRARLATGDQRDQRRRPRGSGDPGPGTGGRRRHRAGPGAARGRGRRRPDLRGDRRGRLPHGPRNAGGVRGGRGRRRGRPSARRPVPGADRGSDRRTTNRSAAALGGGGDPRIFRLLRGDRAALTELVTAIAGEDPVARRHWQTAFVDLDRRDPRRQHRGGVAGFPGGASVLGRVHARAGPRDRGRALVARLPIRRARRMGR